MPPKNRVPKKLSSAKEINDICANKHQGNFNSVQANLRLAPFRKTVMHQVLAIIASDPNGLTLEEIARQIGKQKNAISGRISQLKEDEKIITVGRRDGGSVYVATEKGAA